jgi:hypothetical protein
MKKTVALGMVVTLAALAAGDDKHDTSALVKHLEGTSRQFSESVAGLTPAQWNFKASPDRWSILECAQHIALSEDFLRDIVENKVMKTPPATEEQKASVQGVDDKIIKMIPDRSRKAQAPEPLKPTSGASPEATMADFAAERGKTIAYVKAAGTELRNHVVPHPIFKSADAYQWVLYLSAHTERHVAQILEVKAHPEFPKASARASQIR